MLKNKLINADTRLAEDEKQSTHSTYRLRAKAASEEISKEQFAKVLLMINKKRGYKSSRKAKNEEEGQAIDGMAIAKRLYEEGITPGQLSYQLLKEGKKTLPDYYRSDLQAELERVWNFQKQFYSDTLTDELWKAIAGQGKESTRKRILAITQTYTADIKGMRDEKKLKGYEWRSKAVDTRLSKEELAYVITEINSNINNSSGYLGAISDRSKELYFSQQTVGEYLYAQLKRNSHTRLKQQVFYRQDYLDEFEKIWEVQAKFHAELTTVLKEEIRDIIIFYQRKLKSQKSLISFCEFESKPVETIVNGKTITKTIGYKVSPKSSPLFQEFKIWQVLNSLEAQNVSTKEKKCFNEEANQLLFEELNIKGNLSKEAVFDVLGYKAKEWNLNYTVVEGNRTNQALYNAYLKILEGEGYEIADVLKVKLDKEDVKLSDLNNVPAILIKEKIEEIFKTLNIDTSILHFNAELDGKAFEQQASYQLWHLLYSYEGDDSPSGNEKLYQLLQKKFGFALPHAKVLANVAFSDDYGNLSAKAMRNIFPFIKDSKYSVACAQAGYNHSSSRTKEENENRYLKDKLELLPKNSLRNPVVEKILNQMVNVINAIIDDPNLGKPDEIRIELARELKKNAEERAEMTTAINKANLEHEAIREILKKEDGIKNPTRNDIIRYKLYQELKNNGYHTLYSNTYIPREKLFSKEFDIEHIIPKALLFDDSFSNKTLCLRKENADKGDRCAFDFIGHYFGDDKVEGYKARVEMLYQIGLKSPNEGISKAKYKKLLMKADEIGRGFIERDLRDTQYIAKKAKGMLEDLCRTVVSTSGSITERLREDWDLVNIMQELNFNKYKKFDLTEKVEKKDGSFKERIVDWSKRNDQRHHAMDALTVAFTQHSHIQYLNNLNARKNESNAKHTSIRAIEDKITELVLDEETGKRKRKFISPIPNFRSEAKKHLENVLVSYKAKNKVVTKNKNKFKTKSGEKCKTELTPRGPLHKETVYGRLKQYTVKEEKVGAKWDEAVINKVASPKQREALLQRLRANDNDPKKAFTGKNSLDKHPVFVDANIQRVLPEKVKLVALEDDYTIRKDLTPDYFKDSKKNDDFYSRVMSIYDKGIRNALTARYKQVKAEVEAYNEGKPAKEKRKVLEEAFSNLDKKPIWLNQEKGIAIKRITVSGIKSAEALHYKKDHLGNTILDKQGNKIAVDFVSTGSNHHVAIYRDADGNLQDDVRSFYEVVERARQGLPVIDKTMNKEIGWQFLFSMKQNEFFVFPGDGFNPAEIDLLNPANGKLISANLFRVQKFSKVVYGNSAIRDYVFRHHLETSVEDKKQLKDVAFKSIKSLSFFENIVKVRINHIGQIVKVGEY